MQPQCQARKFVVFGSALDLKAHMVEEHGAEMSARDKKDAMRIQAEFEFEEVGGGRRGRRDRREREQPTTPVPAGPSRPNGAGGRRREAFNGSLTTETSDINRNPNLSQQPSRRQSPSPGHADGESGNIECVFFQHLSWLHFSNNAARRNAALIARINAMAPNPSAAVPAIQAAIRSYRVSESAARDLISTAWNVLDRNLDGTAGIVNVIVDHIDEEDKKRDLLAAWNGFKIEVSTLQSKPPSSAHIWILYKQRGQFPELVPTSTGTQWAGITGGRILNAKNSTSARTSTQSSRQLLDRVARAAASSSSTSSGAPPRPPDRFPPLYTAAPVVANPSFRQPQRNTPWASASSAAAAPVAPRGPTSIPGPGASAKVTKATPSLSKSAFPELPTSNTTRVPKSAVSGNQSLKKILGESTPAVPAWSSDKGSTNGANGNSSSAPAEGETTSQEPTTGKGKKGKGKQKQTLFTLGSFPTQ